MSLVLSKFSFKKHVIGIFLLISVFSWAQTKEEDSLEIDSLIALADKYSRSYETVKLLEVSKKLLPISQKNNNEKGLALGNFWIAFCLSNSGNYTQSNHYLKKIETQKNYLNKNKSFATNVYLSEGVNYQRLGFYTLAAKSIHKALNIIKNSTSENKKDQELYERSAYVNLSNLYNATKTQDSAYYYLNKKKNLTLNGDYLERTYLFNGFGYYHINNKNIDSANFYYQKSLKEFDGKADHYYKADAMRGLGNVLFEQKKYPEALDIYLKALQSYKQMNVWNNEYDLYRSIGEVYNKIENYKEGKHYLERYVSIKDSIESAQKKEGDFIISEVMKAEKEQQENLRKDDLKKAALIIAIISVLLLILFYYFKKSRDKNKQIIIKSKELLQEKEEIISQKDEETQELKLKVNESFEEVIHLAKTNSPEFWARFQEVYPHFQEKLLKVNPQIRTSELTFCAYLFLGFSTKEIADYTFKAGKTIENNRYNIRKKLGLSTEKDLVVWLREQIDSE